jgi:hypothetical protein
VIVSVTLQPRPTSSEGVQSFTVLGRSAVVVGNGHIHWHGPQATLSVKKGALRVALKVNSRNTQFLKMLLTLGFQMADNAPMELEFMAR